MTPDSADLTVQFDRIIDSLTDRFSDSYERPVVARIVADMRHQLESTARVTTYLPLLVSRRASDQLAGRRLAAAAT